MYWNIQNKLTDEDNLVDLLLENRGLTTKKEIDLFLNPPKVFDLLKELTDDFKEDAKKARDLINDAIKDELPIVIHGDYDADGICAAAILTSVLRNDLSHTKVFPLSRSFHK